MRKKYSIGLLLAVLCLASLSFAFHAEYKYDREQARLLAEKELEQQKEQQSISTQGNAEKSECFYLRELNGFVAVYQNDKKTVYEYTNIRVDDLPEELRKEIQSGKKIESTEKLYGFLENYSS